MRNTMKPRHRTFLFFVLACGLAIAPARTYAHAQLDHADPPVGSTVKAPREVRMSFTQALEPRFSKAQLRSGGDKAIASGGVDPAQPTQMVIHVPNNLAPGTYKVRWQVMSVDSHPTQGNFTFTVQP